MKKSKTIKNLKSLNKKTAPVQSRLFPNLDLKSTEDMINLINDRYLEIKEIEAEAKSRIIKLRKEIQGCMKFILKLALMNWQYFFAGGKKSLKLAYFLGWSRRSPRIVLTRKEDEIIKYLEERALPQFIKKSVDMTALKRNLKIARTIPGVEVVPQENLIWVVVGGARLVINKKKVVPVYQGKRVSLTMGNKKLIEKLSRL